MTQIRGYMAISLDGYIATPDGGVEWLEPFQAYDYGYKGFLSELSTVVLGRLTYEQTKSFGTGWHYPGKRGVIVASKPLGELPSGVEQWTKDIPALVTYLHTLKEGDIWIVGGAQLQQSFLDLNAMDILDIFIIPVLLGDGISMFPKSKHQHHLNLSSVQKLDAGVVRLTYKLKK